MTISKYIADFLKLYETIEITTNHLAEGADKYGLFRSPARRVVHTIDGSMLVTESFTFYAAQRSISETERKEDDEWLEDLMYWVDDYGYTYDYPEIDKLRTVREITVTGTPSQFSDDNNGIIYQITLSITYEREVN